MPGKVVQCLKATGVSNPLVLIDEIDKLGRGFGGDPASALLELLDAEQNAAFVDHYLDTPVDVSRVLFVCTANVLDTIPAPLLDRMEVIRLAGYVATEKMAIARKYLEPAARKASGIDDGAAVLTDGAVAALAETYCREAGVRALAAALDKIYRKRALAVVRTRQAVAAQPTSDDVGPPTAVVIDASDLASYLGAPPFPADKLYDVPPPGVVTGLAWTANGGSTLYIECSAVEIAPGKGGFRATGTLGDVMKESAEIAHCVARVFFAKLFDQSGRDPPSAGAAFFADARFHVHVPAGATPKDGPSAGCALVTAMLSVALGRAVTHGLAMTGEISLTGLVLPVGGIREKTVAARRSGITSIVLPAANRREWEEVPAEVREGLTPHFVERYDEVFTLALGGMGEVAQPKQEESVHLP